MIIVSLNEYNNIFSKDKFRFCIYYNCTHYDVRLSLEDNPQQFAAFEILYLVLYDS